jgi:elongation factor P hydroxylase
VGVQARIDDPLRSRFEARRLECVFAACFRAELRTRLQGGAPEPLYEPAVSNDGEHILYYRDDFFASALHEVAHWCIAGPERRRLLDFGYWYAPDGRSPAQQQAFEVVEEKPQALEWFFCKACDYRFRISVDNLEAEGRLPDTTFFQRRLLDRVRLLQRQGLPPRAERFYRALCREFGTAIASADLCFSGEELV